jgi:uracil-DNA glycosylase family 4
MDAEDAANARRELRDIARSLRALVQWQDACGVEALPPAPAMSRAIEADPIADPPKAKRPAVERSAPAQIEPALPAPEVQLSPDERKKRLVVLAETVSTCTLCVLSEKRTQTVFARGNPLAELCFIGEGPGEDEDREGLPFVGKAGQLLDKMIAAMGLTSNDIYICNIVKCRPPGNRNPLPAEVSACAPYLAEQLDLVRPKVIVTLGNVPLKALFGVDGITKLRGSWRVYKGSIPVMPTYHPAYVLRTPTPQVKGEVWKDLREVLRQLGRPLPTRGST